MNPNHQIAADLNDHASKIENMPVINRALVIDLRLAAEALIKEPAKTQVIVLPPPAFLTVEQHVWLSAWCACDSSYNSSTESASTHADACLQKFGEKFRK